MCPTCGSLTHRDRLEALAAQASTSSNTSDALAAWREALGLLPTESAQATQVRQRILALSAELDAPADSPTPGKPGRGLIGTLVAGTLLVLGKLKYLLLGLGKFTTLLSMFASFAVYTELWGWRFALGFVAGIYVHEIGHVVALRRYGIAASAPMFIPGFGALVRLQQYPATAIEDARVGIAGPVWGGAASLVAWAVASALKSDLWLGIAQTTATINLFNLLPFWQLDGGRAVRALSKVERGGLAILFGAAGLAMSQPMAVMVGMGLGFRAFSGADAPARGDRQTLLWFALLGAGLCAIGAPQGS